MGISYSIKGGKIWQDISHDIVADSNWTREIFDESKLLGLKKDVIAEIDTEIAKCDAVISVYTTKKSDLNTKKTAINAL